MLARLLKKWCAKPGSRRNRSSWLWGRVTVEKLRRKGLLLEQPFRARRAFEAAEHNDEGPHYFMELDDGRILFLSGQYLMDYGPITDAPELNQPRSFPCSEFVVLRHKSAGYVMKIQTGGQVLEPEAQLPRITRKTWPYKKIPQDGLVLSDITYDELKRSLANG